MESAQALAQASALQPSQIYHWEGFCFTQRHRLTDLTVTLDRLFLVITIAAYLALGLATYRTLCLQTY